MTDKKKYCMGIDVGGTFTDGVLSDDAGNFFIFKTPTVTGEPSAGFMNCLGRAADFLGLSLIDFLQSLDKLAYGTTIATNILIEGKAARTGLITTKGFRDTLPLMRTARDRMGLDLQCERFPPLTPRSLIEEVSERIDYAGDEVTPLSITDVEDALEKLSSKGAEALAVCLLWSFKNSSHEKTIGKIIKKKLPAIYFSLSCDIAPISGEYERTATTVMNASLGPPIKKHLDLLTDELEKKNLRTPLLIMQSTGGVVPAADAAMKPVTLVNSGPSGGLIASKYISQLLGEHNVICIDMGGTSFDASLITGGEYSASLVTMAVNQDIYVPQLDIYSIGAGGGSIAWLDMGKRLKVGPRSAGAFPGPVCYGRGGKEPAVTDADAVLGRINPEYFLGGEMSLDVDKAAQAIEEKLARPLGLSLVETASGICRIVDASMSNAIRVITVEKGYDPREYAMIAFGGAGPVHCASLAKELGIKKVIIPYLATAQSAFGIAASDIVHSLSQSDVAGPEELDKINGHFSNLKNKGLSLLNKEKIDTDNIEMLASVDIRYKQQSHEVNIPVPDKTLNADDMARLTETFEQRYEAIYGAGTAFRRAGFEIVTFRVDAIGKIRKPVLQKHGSAGKDSSRALKGKRKVFFDSSFIGADIYDGDRLKPGNTLKGPAIVEYKGTTAVIHPEQSGIVDNYLNLILS